jgi:hypothetical protein
MTGKRSNQRRPRGRSGNPPITARQQKYISLSSPPQDVRAVNTTAAVQSVAPTATGAGTTPAPAPLELLITPPASDLKRNPTIRLTSGRHTLLGLPALTPSADHLAACASAVQGLQEAAALEPAAALGPQRAQRVLHAQLDAAGALALSAAVATVNMPKRKIPAGSSVSGSSSSESSEIPETLLVENPHAAEKSWALAVPSFQPLKPCHATPDTTCNIITSTATSQQQAEQQQQQLFPAASLTQIRISSLAQQVGRHTRGQQHPACLHVLHAYIDRHVDTRVF